MISRCLTLVLLSLPIGCTSYSDVAGVNRTNLDYLRQLEIQLSTTPAEAQKLDGKTPEEIDAALATHQKLLSTELALLFSNKEFWTSYYLKRDQAYRTMIDYIESHGRKADDPADAGHSKDGPKVPPAVQAAIRQSLELDYLDEFARFDAESKAITKLYLDLIRALAALRKNGADIQDYLDMAWHERLFTDVKGMDEAKLKEIGEDLSEAMKALKD